MKRVFIIHGWGGHPNEHWMPWLAKELMDKGFEVHQPQMLGTDFPKMDAWISYLKEQIGTADRDTYLVGHSIGCLAILRYLEKYQKHIRGVVLVAPFVKLNPASLPTEEDKAVETEWTAGGFNWNELKESSPHFSALFSKDDPDVLYDENKPVFENDLGAKIIVFENKGHFTASAGVTELPEALAEVLAMGQG